MVPKPLLWLGTSRQDVRDFPEVARGKVGHGLFSVQQGLEPSDWKPIGSVGPGVRELRIHTGAEFRVIYIARFDEGVYVLHAFEKRSRQTRAVDLELARKRLRDLIRLRQRR